ncbi:hypothetical protein N0V86_008650 [Didymella sp. IMI 355093]|nr:hypothetical protein N0V86_008650 [Didymella sp. IMI 355093]
MDCEYSTHTRPGSSIEDLSAELVFMIMDHLPAPTHFDLACACKRLATTSRGVLERHQGSHKAYSTASDLDPSTVPLLLRSAFGQGDSIPAWHVRSFEVWKDRTTWSDWQTFDLFTPLIPEQNSKPPSSRVSREDARRYLYWFEEQLGEDLEIELIEKLLAQIESGHDGLLKALLFAKLERLEDLNFVTRAQETGSCLTSLRILIAECIKKKVSDSEEHKRQDDEQYCEDSDSDCRLVVTGEGELHSEIPTSPWSPGFRNIRKVAVGVASGTWMDDNRDEESCIFLFSHLLRLPSLNSIYFKRLFGHESHWEGEWGPGVEFYDYNVLPACSSSVQHIFLHGCSGTFGEEADELWRGPRELLTMSFRFDGPEEFDGATGIAHGLSRVQKSSLRSLMWYGYQGGYGSRNILGNHCSIHDNEEFDYFKRLPAIKQVSYSAHDIGLCMEHADTYPCLRSDSEEGRDDEDDQGNIYDEDDDKEFVVRRVATMFPRTIETLVLWDKPDEEGMDMLVSRGITRMIQGGQYKNLKAVFLEATERKAEGTEKIVWLYEDAIAAGVAAGVDVHTLSSRVATRHSIDFMEAPDEYDLKSGLHAGIRPGNWIFDPYLGRRISPDSKAERYDTLWAGLKAREACAADMDEYRE